MDTNKIMQIELENLDTLKLEINPRVGELLNNIAKVSEKFSKKHKKTKLTFFYPHGAEHIAVTASSKHWSLDFFVPLKGYKLKFKTLNAAYKEAKEDFKLEKA